MFGLQTPAGGPRSPFYELANSAPAQDLPASPDSKLPRGR